MWRTGVSRRRRHSALSEMIDAAAHKGAVEAPWRAAPQVFEHYADEGDVLRDLQRRWRTALAGEIYLAIEKGQGDLHQDVSSAWAKVLRRHSSIRATLEAHAEHPAIAAAMRKERALLSCIKGTVDHTAA